MVNVHAYPWDVLGDPGFADRVRESGADAVTLAMSYHSTRAATPLHPQRRFVDAHHGALYRPVRPSAWAGRRLAPLGPSWMAQPDPGREAAETLAAAGVAVNAWIVLAHNSRLGLAFPELAVLNCFGERYPYALCPAQPEVRDHCAVLAAEALHDLPTLASVSLESVGQMGATHLGCHEKTDGAYPPLAVRALSVCCCSACQTRWRARGLDPAAAVAALRAAAQPGVAFPPGVPPERGAGKQIGAIPDDVAAVNQTGAAIPDDVAAVLLGVRQEATDELRAAVLAAVRRAAPGALITLHGHPDPWATGPSPGLTPAAVSDVDAVLVPCWPTAEQTADLVKATAALGAVVDAYVSVLPPADLGALPGHVRRLREAGATRLSLYHLGLAPAGLQPVLRQLAKEFRVA
ncbi:hypothetical protein Rhe02_83070 [Rhizocola hellebori]|uniref:Alanine-rich protein n=1 Tax=Rhizocola hellebori TaxID=1392758 RepID=A0A8J3VKX8_9ACTN|nr:hypothetical protein [Rhizocola hellebori]GIH10240.1 hypothetical protein Rhe02_83070 [Rhizocola hellebori]